MFDQNSELDGMEMEIHPAHKKAEDISKQVPEIAALYRSVGMKSYRQYDLESPIDEDIETKQQQIDDILWDLAYNEIANEPDSKYFKECAVELAKKYINLEWLHTPWTTSKILTQVLDSELVPLKKEAFGSGIPGTLSALVPGIWGLVLRTMLPLLRFIVLLLITVGLISYGHPILALLAAAYMVWVFGQKSFRFFSVRRERKRLFELYHQLHLIREEVASGCFDYKEVDRRLRISEENGLYVHSLSHALLRTPHDSSESDL
ncbi:MAG: hypothetical protein WBW33_32010 [Bryobacteraceae bacterium]